MSISDILKEQQTKLQECLGADITLSLNKDPTDPSQFRLTVAKAGNELAFIIFSNLKLGDYSCAFIETSVTNPMARGFNLNPMLKCILIKISIPLGHQFIFAESISPVTAKINTELGFIDVGDGSFGEFEAAMSIYEKKEGGISTGEYEYNRVSFVFNKNGVEEEKEFTHALNLMKESVLQTALSTCITKFASKGKSCSLGGNYYKKYLKYKTKYLQLKNNISNIK
jgi:hypothetical protein